MRRSFLPPEHASAPGMGAFRIVMLILAFVGVVWLMRSGAHTLSSGVMLLAGPPAAAGSGSGGLTPAEQAALDGRNRELQARLAAALAAQQAGSGAGSGSGAHP